MYSGSSDGDGPDSSAARKIPPASSMLWVRNIRRYIGSGAGLGSEALMELETKRILLEIFIEKQQKNAESGTIPSFYKKKPEEGSISHRVQRLAKYRFLKKQSDLLLNADDLDAMWVCLRENCVIDDSTGAEKKYLLWWNFSHTSSDVISTRPQNAQGQRKAWEPLELPEGPITRGRLKKFKEALNGVMMIQDIPNSMEIKSGGMKIDDHTLGRPYNVIKVKMDQAEQEQEKGDRFILAGAVTFDRSSENCTPGFPLERVRAFGTKSRQ